MESLKFLMVSTHYPPAHLGGDARFVEYLSNELVKLGHEVHVLHSPYAFALQRGFLPDMPKTTADGVHIHTHLSAFGRVGPALGLVLGRSPGAARHFRETISMIRPEVTHWHNTKGFMGQPISSSSGSSLYTAHDYYAVCPKSNLLRPNMKPCETPLLCQSCLMLSRKPPQLWRAAGNRALNMPDGVRVIAPSMFLAKRLSTEGIRVDHILRNFSPDIGISASNEVASRIIYLGILERFKGLMTLLDAFNISRDLQGFELSIFGEGSLRADLEKRTEALGLNGRVRIQGYAPLNEIRGTFCEAAAIVVPSESYENAPLVALEALSMGIPLLGSDIGGLPEILTPGSGSILVPPGNSVRLADEIVNLWNNREGLRERSAKARATYESLYSPIAHIKAYLKIVLESTT